MEPVRVPRLMVAAPASGQGKTALTCALLRCAQRSGRAPRAFKCGPDYIDPMFHRAVLGVPSRNLDLFFSGEDEVRALLAAHGGDSLAVLEGAMGFYDGIGGTDRASSWHLARATRTPVVLAAAPGGTALTMAAALKGLKEFRVPSQIAGVILDRCSERLFRLLAPVIRAETGLEVYGYLPERPECAVPSRHLGLVTAEELPQLQGIVERLAEQMERTVDVPALLALADSAPALEGDGYPPEPYGGGVRIAVARDRAFCFYYEENLDLLRRSGAELVSFSPLEDRELSENTPMRTAVRAAVRAGMPALAECGAFLYLQESLEDGQGRAWPMAGVFSGRGVRGADRSRFGYVELTAGRENPYLRPGESIRGHEFHRWDCTENGGVCRADKPLSDAGWDCMSVEKNCFAGFPHLYLPSNPAFARRFVERCRRFEQEAL